MSGEKGGGLEGLRPHVHGLSPWTGQGTLPMSYWLALLLCLLVIQVAQTPLEDSGTKQNVQMNK